MLLGESMRNALLSGVSAIALFVVVEGTAPAAAQESLDRAGVYVGAHAGYGEADFSGVYDNASGQIGSLGNLDLNGFAAGFHLGFNHLIPSGREGIDALLLGIEGDVTFMDWDDTLPHPSGTIAGVEGELDLLASVRGRIGIVRDQAVIYATGGVAFKDAQFNVLSGLQPGGSRDLDDIGGVVGGGIEFAPRDNAAVLFRVEGLYYFFDDKVTFTGSELGDADPGDVVEFEDAFVVRAGLTIPMGRVRSAAK